MTGRRFRRSTHLPFLATKRATKIVRLRSSILASDQISGFAFVSFEKVFSRGLSDVKPVGRKPERIWKRKLATFGTRRTARELEQKRNTMPSTRVRQAWGSEPTAGLEARDPSTTQVETHVEDDREELEGTKYAWFEQVAALKQKQAYVERHLRLGLDSLKNKLSERNYDVQQLTAAAIDKSEFSKFRGELDDGLGRARSSLRHLQSLLSAPATSEMYVSTLATQMDACETEIESLKIQQNQDYERLNRVEVLLTREIEAFQRRIEGTAWEAPSSSSGAGYSHGKGSHYDSAAKKSAS